MTVTESKDLKKGNRVYWRGDATDCGIITETSWDAVIISWNSGQLASVHHGDMREIQTRAASFPSATEYCQIKFNQVRSLSLHGPRFRQDHPQRPDRKRPVAASPLCRSGVRGHRSEIVFGVLVVILRSDQNARLGFGLG
jgi:hypothetical protein